MRLSGTRPSFTADLSPSERGFLRVLQQLGFGHLESIKIRRSALVLDPWPKTGQLLKFGAAENQPVSRAAVFELKKSIAEFF
jgi:hypothetical protein